MKKKKKIKRKDNKLLIIIIIVLIIFSYFELTGDIRIGIILNDFLYYPSNIVKKENVTDYLDKEIIEENEELKALSQIDYSLTDFKTINATIIERNSSFWLNELTINKGSIDGVEVKDAVITNNGLIGEISFISLNSSKVKLITDDSYQVFVSINKLNKILSVKDNKLIIKGINERDNIKIGDKVVTNGLQNKYPKGIMIGKIKNIESESNYVGLIAEVELETNLNNIRFVTVLNRNIK